MWAKCEVVDSSNVDAPLLKNSGRSVWDVLNAYDTGMDSQGIAAQFGVSVREVETVLRHAHRFLPEMWPVDWTVCSAIERVPGRCGGWPVVRNSRMPIYLAIDNLEDDVLPEEFSEDYDLDLDDVRTLFEFLKHQQLPMAS